ncbi:testis-specific protein TEX28 [Tachyglossus aculeatus]|uniref:testis-specific protein TEX28 n=1 Tax=Tachyglossus aculeatus TaxID=9261 RepID=UPI0018F41F02|nr:testis-specific protein TEX28 [Tachyglossus aculeatus]
MLARTVKWARPPSGSFSASPEEVTGEICFWQTERQKATCLPLGRTASSRGSLREVNGCKLRQGKTTSAHRPHQPESGRRSNAATLHSFISVSVQPRRKQSWLVRIEQFPPAKQHGKSVKPHLAFSAEQGSLKEVRAGPRCHPAPGGICQAKPMKSPSPGLPPDDPSLVPRSSGTEAPGIRQHSASAELNRILQDTIKHRILYLSEQLKVEKASRDENTVGYLKLVSKADRHQAPLIRQAFEKVNQRSSATIGQIERKLQQTYRQLQELELAVKPRSSALYTDASFPETEQSVENVLRCEYPEPEETGPPPANVTCTSQEDDSSGSHQDQTSKTGSLNRQDNLTIQKMNEQLEVIKMFHSSLETDFQNLKVKYLSELEQIVECLQEEKCRHRLIEDQVNDHMQVHLDEILCLKQDLASTEEKMVYQSYEKAKEIWEVMESFQTRISKLEALQQTAQLEMVEKRKNQAQVFLDKFMNLLVTLTNILLVCVTSVSSCPLSLIRSPPRILAIFMVISLGAVAWQKWQARSNTDWHAWLSSRWKG